MKQVLRNQALSERKKLSLTNRIDKSNTIVNQLLPYLKDKKVIGIYMPMREEVDISSLLFMYPTLSIPKVRNNKEMDFFMISSANDVKEGVFQVLEPTTNVWVDPKQLDAIIVPIVAFDQHKNRIGYGKGYYDRYLKQTTALKIGVAFDCQWVDDIDEEKTDVRLDIIITESKII